MGNITLSIPEGLFKKMKTFREIKWSEVARQAIENKIDTLEEMEEISKKSQLTKKDIEEFNKKIKSIATKKFINENSN